MKTFKEIYFEKFKTYIKSPWSRDVCEIQINPVWSELKSVADKINIVRAILDTTTGNLYAWNPDLLHRDVINDESVGIYDNRKELLTLELMINNEGFIDVITVTRTSDLKWSDEKKTKDVLKSSPNITKLLSNEFIENPDDNIHVLV